MDIEMLKVGTLHENCYIVTKDDKTLIVDPGDEADKIIYACKGKDVVEVIITHHHFDHVGALREIEEHFNIKENVKSGYFNYEVIETPGHTSDSISYYFKDDNVMFTGDFLFKNTIGRTDLPTSSVSDMLDSLNKVREYSDDIRVFPGHGNCTILGDEKKNFDKYF